ncbi:DUF4296 domain-containing protein [Polluticaenibacter yanchengensis]|uniref:DUF4296 domain-containing protein n=1 Tax=Polluticaenibacter yanchengensis TaxID=3014562 RepID=A0ABT4UQ17_9BACT|nr:DUF4296 domain-containing protein [Chitinophagaceae bacterium LY-5]
MKIGGILGLAMVVFGLVSCETKPGSKGILSINDMKLVMYDIILVDEYVYNNIKRDSTNAYNDTLNKKYQQVFQLHGIAQETFFKSYEFYNAHPGYYNILLDSLQNYSNRKREVNYQQENPELTQEKPLENDTAHVLPKTDSLTPVVLDSNINELKVTDSQNAIIQKRFKEIKNRKELIKPQITP